MVAIVSSVLAFAGERLGRLRVVVRAKKQGGKNPSPSVVRGVPPGPLRPGAPAPRLPRLPFRRRTSRWVGMAEEFAVDEDVHFLQNRALRDEEDDRRNPINGNGTNGHWQHSNSTRWAAETTKEDSAGPSNGRFEAELERTSMSPSRARGGDRIAASKWAGLRDIAVVDGGGVSADTRTEPDEPNGHRGLNALETAAEAVLFQNNITAAASAASRASDSIIDLEQKIEHAKIHVQRALRARKNGGTPSQGTVNGHKNGQRTKKNGNDKNSNTNGFGGSWAAVVSRRWSALEEESDRDLVAAELPDLYRPEEGAEAEKRVSLNTWAAVVSERWSGLEAESSVDITVAELPDLYTHRGGIDGDRVRVAVYNSVVPRDSVASDAKRRMWSDLSNASAVASAAADPTAAALAAAKRHPNEFRSNIVVVPTPPPPLAPEENPTSRHRRGIVNWASLADECAVDDCTDALEESEARPKLEKTSLNKVDKTPFFSEARNGVEKNGGLSSKKNGFESNGVVLGAEYLARALSVAVAPKIVTQFETEALFEADAVLEAEAEADVVLEAEAEADIVLEAEAEADAMLEAEDVLEADAVLEELPVPKVEPVPEPEEAPRFHEASEPLIAAAAAAAAGFGPGLSGIVALVASFFPVRLALEEAKVQRAEVDAQSEVERDAARLTRAFVAAVITAAVGSAMFGFFRAATWFNPITGRAPQVTRPCANAPATESDAMDAQVEKLLPQRVWKEYQLS